MKVLTYFYLNWQGVLTVSAEIKTRIYTPLWSDKENSNFWLCVMFCLWWCSSRRMSSFGSCLGSDSGIPLRKNTPVYSDKSRASQSSQHDITAPEPSLISSINLQLPPQSFVFTRLYALMRFFLEKQALWHLEIVHWSWRGESLHYGCFKVKWLHLQNVFPFRN